MRAKKRKSRKQKYQKVQITMILVMLQKQYWKAKIQKSQAGQIAITVILKK
jgi:hypothetical protein